MQQRRGTAAQWISTNNGDGPILAIGEIGYESDTNKFKIGDGVNHWVDLSYFVDLETTIAGAPGLLNSLDELAAAIGDDPAFFTTVATNLSNHQSDTTNIHGIADTSLLVTTTGTQTLTNKTITSPSGLVKADVGLSNVDNTSDANKPVSTATQAALDLKANSSAITELAQDAVNTAIVAGTGLDKVYDDAANTITLDIDSTVATKTYADNAVSTHNSDTTNIHGIADTADLATQDYVLDQISNSTDAYPDMAGDGIAWDAVNEAFDVDNTVARVSDVQSDLDLKANIDSPTFTGTVAGVTKAHVGLGNVDNTSDENKPLSTAATTALNLKAPLAGPVFTGTTRTDDLVVDGDFTVNGTNFSASATSITVEDNIVQLAHQNPANTVDLGLVVSYNYNAEEGGMHAGLVRDVSESVWKLFKNVEAEPSTTVDFANGELDALQVGGFFASSAVIGGVNDTEIQYLNGVTSAIQDQLDDKLESTTAASTYAPIASPTFTGTVSGVTKAMVGLGNVDNSADLDKPISTLTQTALDAKASTANPTFTGTVAGISKSMVGLGNVDNTADLSKPVSSATQTSLDLKAPLASPTFTGTVTLPSGTVTSGMIADGTIVDADVNASAAIAQSKISGLTSDLAAKAPLASPTFTGTVAGITKTMVGLANVDNTSDASKPVSTDTQAALDLKAPLANPTFTGTVAGVTKSMVGLGNVDNTTDAGKPVSTATQTALDLKAPIASPTFTGTVAGITKSMVGLGSVDNTTDAGKPVSTATQTALDLKANLDSPTFTGTVTLPTGTVTSAMILDGTIVAGDLADGSVTSGKILDGTIVNADINASAAIDWTKLAISSTVNATELGYLDGVTSSVQTQVDAKLAKSGGTMTGALTLSGAPTIDLHAATKAYVDNVVSGLNFHQPVRVATTANITLSGTQTIDGVAAIAGDRVLVKDQTDQKTNGIYVVSASTWSRATDADNTPDGELKGGDFTLVLEGTANEGYGYVCSNTSAVSIGTTNITYAPFNAAKAVTAGSGLTESAPGTIAIATGGVTSAMIADATIVDGDISASAAIAQSKIDGLSTSLGLKANLAGPTFTGTVTIPSGAALGTPASATLTNATGLPVSTGISGLGTGVATFLGTPSSANLASMVTDEIGTGNLILSDLATNAQSGGTYTLVLSDKGKLIELSNGSANALTIPLNATAAFPIGSQITVLQTGSGTSQINVAAGVTLNCTPQGTANVSKFRAQWSSITLIKRAENTWVAVGDITA